MKKEIFMLITLLLLTTGCTCEYNLTIEENTYKEQITIIGSTAEEILNFNNRWQIPIDKEDYNNINLETGSDDEFTGEIYKYNLTGNRLTFSYNFNQNQYMNSTAISNCYDILTITNSNNKIIISTSSNTKCFENHPPLKSIEVNIKIDKPVISNNADRINGNTYIWNINKSNAEDKSINLILENKSNNKNENIGINNQKLSKETIFEKYAIYIFIIVLLLIIFFIYKWFMKFKEKNNDIE